MEVRTHPSNSQVPRGAGGAVLGAEIVSQLQKAEVGGGGGGALSHATRLQFNYC